VPVLLAFVLQHATFSHPTSSLPELIIYEIHNIVLCVFLQPLFYSNVPF